MWGFKKKQPKQKDTAINEESTLKEVKDSQTEEVTTLESVLDETLKENTGSSVSLKKSFEEVIKVFDKHLSQEAMYSNVVLGEDGKLSPADLFSVAKNLQLRSEMRRINILDVKYGPCIFLLKDSKHKVLLNDNQLFDPETGEYSTFNPKDIIEDYIGYTLFISEEELTLSSFIKKTSFLFESIKSFKPIFIEVVVMSLFINLFAVVSPFFTMNVYDRVIPNYATSTLFVLAFGMILVYIFDLIFKMIRGYLVDYISLNIGNEVDQVLFSKIMLAKAPGLSLSNGAKNVLFKELSMVRDFYFSRFIPTLIDLPFLILFLVILLFISPWIALVPFIAAIIVFVINILLQVPLQQSHSKMVAEDQNRGSLLVEAIAGEETIKTFNALGKFLFRWRRVLDKSYRTTFAHNIWFNFSSNFSIFVMNIVVILVMVIGVFEITNNVLTTGALIASTTIASRIMTNIIAFSAVVVRYRSIQNILRYLESVVNAPMEGDVQNLGKRSPLKGHIEFKNVAFFYQGLKTPILYKCNFNIQPQSKVAIIGKTGSGKSTITRLILGLDFHNEGQILIDDININDIQINELRSNIGFMPQKSFFFRGTIRENILMNNIAVSEEQYQQACKLAGVDIITSLSNRADDMLVLEQGRNLSGGQQQIIALARAILHNPPIIIMDEPTNGMDTTLEATFVEKTKAYVKDKTFILITHKSSQLNLVDRVILLDNSTVIIDDTKEKVIELLSKSKKRDI